MLSTVEIASPVWRRVERALGTEITAAEKQATGTHSQTYLIISGNRKWIVRMRKGARHRLKQALAAQSAAASKGVPVPAVAAAETARAAHDGYAWIVEEYVRGSLFYPERMDAATSRQTSGDIGRQLRRLHSIEVSGFGKLSADLARARHASSAGWVEEHQAKVEDARRIGSLEPDVVARVASAYRFLKTYREAPSLCHGDFADDNLLVHNGRLAAVIDWELALGCDPAHDVAYWFMWHQDSGCLDALLAGYRPRDPVYFRRRIGAHIMLLAVKFSVWFHSRGETANVQHCTGLLRKNDMRW